MACMPKWPWIRSIYIVRVNWTDTVWPLIDSAHKLMQECVMRNGTRLTISASVRVDKRTKKHIYIKVTMCVPCITGVPTWWTIDCSDYDSSMWVYCMRMSLHC